MAISTETIGLDDYVRVLRRRWRWVAVGAVLGAVVGYVLAEPGPRMYESSAKVFVRADATDRTPRALDVSMSTEAEIVASEAVAAGVVRRLDLDDAADRLADDVSVRALSDSVVLEIAYEDGDPARAQAITQAFAESYVDYREGDVSVAPSIISSADEASEVPQPSRAMSGAMGALIGALIGIAVAFLRDRMDRHYRHLHEIEAAVGAPVLGVAEPGSDKVDWRGGPNGSFRTVGVALARFERRRRARTIVLAPVRDERSADVAAVHTAAAIAELGRRVVLVPTPAHAADLRADPRDQRVLPERVGDRGEIVGSSVERLRIARPLGENGVLRGHSALAIAQNLNGQADNIVLSSPPLVDGGDAIDMAWNSDGVVLVVNARDTRDVLDRVVLDLRAVGAPILGAVVVRGDRDRHLSLSSSRPIT